METLTVAECAELIGKSQQSVRIGLQRGFFKFGTAVQTKEPTSSRPRGSMILTREQVIRILGWDQPEGDEENGKIANRRKIL